MKAYYNDNNHHAAQWLRILISAGHIPAGDVDERSIVNVRPDDLRGYVQCHFFAGLGGWPLAARLAGVPDDCPLWTGSCPCQGISGLGSKDDNWTEWRVWRPLIQQLRPPVIFGEQVAGGTGPRWLAGVRADLEADAYAVGGSNLPACCVAAPQERERLWFVALGYAEGERWREGIRPFNPPARSWAAPGQSPWASEIVLGQDGLRRRIKPGTQFLAYGIPDRVADLRAFGNAIVPQVGAEFIRAAVEGVMALNIHKGQEP